MKRFLVCAALAVASITLGYERDAEACGGCFVPQENPTVVNDHRMILTIAKDKSTLYDQIKYSGSPSSFAWVLPIAGTVDVGLSADVVFSALDTQTQTQLLAPPQNCPPPPDGCFRGGSSSGGGGAGLNAPSADESSVQVLKQEVVGPYETVQLASDNANALNEWLAANGFTVPQDVQPVIAAYVTEKFNFLALKLQPGKGVQDMRPVRVTTSGAGAVLPLRMVAAGTDRRSASASGSSAKGVTSRRTSRRSSSTRRTSSGTGRRRGAITPSSAQRRPPQAMAASGRSRARWPSIARPSKRS